MSRRPDMWNDDGAWVRRADTTSPGHICELPTRVVRYEFPSAALAPGGTPTVHEETIPDGTLGDLWRCFCGKLWRVGYDCDDCDHYPRSHGRHGTLAHLFGGLGWRPATFWQRLAHR